MKIFSVQVRREYCDILRDQLKNTRNQLPKTYRRCRKRHSSSINLLMQTTFAKINKIAISNLRVYISAQS